MSRLPSNWGHLIPDSPFTAIFPDGRVPLKSIVPIIPREVGAPPCYLVPGAALTEGQITALAALLWPLWSPECTSADEAAVYIRDDALPLRTTWFSGVGTTQIAWFLDDDLMAADADAELAERADRENDDADGWDDRRPYDDEG